MIFGDVAGLHIGLVETCSPTELKVLLDSDAPHDVAFNAGQPQSFPRLNGYVLMPNEGGAVVAVIGRMTMEPAPPGTSDRAERIPLPTSRRRLFVTPIGTLETRRISGSVSYALKRGIGSYPAVGDSVALPTSDQLKAVVEASGTDRRVQIGTSKIALEASVTIDPDKLFGRHLGVFGNTGSGKSCTVAGLIRWTVLEAAKAKGQASSRIILLDPNGEYRDCFQDLQDRVDVKVFSAEPREGELPLKVPAWMWNGHEWAGALNASPGAQRPVLMQALRQLRAATIGGVEPDASSDRILFAGHLRAMTDYLREAHSQGVAALSSFPRFKAIHENLEGFEAQLAALLTAVAQEEAALFDTTEAAAETIGRVRRRRMYEYNGEDRVSQFQPADIAEIIGALESLLAHLPDAAIVSGPSEDMPARFDPFRLPDTVSLLASLQGGNLQQHMGGMDLRIRTLLNDTRITPIIAPDDDQATLGSWLRDMFGGSPDKGQITILDLSLVPADVLTTIVSVLARLVFEAAQRHRRIAGVTLPTLLVLEEAHNFVQRVGPDSEDGPSSRCRQVFEKIAKEGRKFGVGLMLSSQRPAELAPTVVAQCNSFVLHRIVNDRDQELVARLAPDSTGTLLKELPSLPTQQAILMGIATEIPLVFEVRELATAERPDSAHPDFWAAWQRERALKLDFEVLAASWAQ